eukprot:2954765-Rhodomonas_salina.9
MSGTGLDYAATHLLCGIRHRPRLCCYAIAMRCPVETALFVSLDNNETDRVCCYALDTRCPALAVYQELCPSIVSSVASPLSSYAPATRCPIANSTDTKYGMPGVHRHSLSDARY